MISLDSLEIILWNYAYLSEIILTHCAIILWSLVCAVLLHYIRVGKSKHICLSVIGLFDINSLLKNSIISLLYCTVAWESFTLPIHSLCQLHTAPIPTGVRCLTAFRSTPHCFYTYCTWVVQRWTAYVPTCSY